ncbi:hypothetical protein ADK60_32155 [Streptomyces sp. XY431]|uniref:hypothetical protein n=1 Tax=Streptomyces sp. XY431 TaxID=1415562 RepID=UPI0006AD8B97|nr:hypothetical protein [Streptomyces sp. XY431]KOV12357.1 hypothetical protein ADK60_32155 [Streptomyces sp. XY431]
MSFQPDDDTRHDLTAAHTKAAGFLGLVCTGPQVFGTSGATVGRQAEDVWLRVSRSSRRRAPRPTGQGALGAEQLVPATVPRPRLHDTLDWTEASWFYQADVFDLVGPAVSSTPDLRSDPGLDDGWWTVLRNALAGIAEAPTAKITLRQTWIEEVFPKYLGIPAPAEVERIAGHGDLQWANLTAEPLEILDWERWGLVPVGYDPAVLWVSSLLVPGVANRVRSEFAEILETPAGRIGQLIALAEMLQAVDRGYYPELAPLLADQAQELTGVLGWPGVSTSPS